MNLNVITSLRLGGIGALIGGTGGLVTNGLHPRVPQKTDELLTLVASTPHWIVIHYAAALAAVSTVVAIALFLRRVNDARARAIGEAGKYTAALGAAVFLVAIMVDGYGFPHFAAQWMAAEPAEKLMVLWAASAVQTVDVALFPVWAGVFLGIGIVLVSFAIWYSNEYSRALAVLGIAGATMCFVYALPASLVSGFRFGPGGRQ